MISFRLYFPSISLGLSIDKVILKDYFLDNSIEIETVVELLINIHEPLNIHQSLTIIHQVFSQIFIGFLDFVKSLSTVHGSLLICFDEQ